MLEPDLSSVMIFAAGFGTRMGALTQSCPKPLLRLGDRVLIDHAVDHAHAFGPRHIVVNAHYHADQIVAHFEHTDVRVSVEQPEILDTGGGLKAALPLLETDIIITMNSDTLWTGPNPIDVLARAWRPEVMDALLLCVTPDMAIGREGAGDFSIDDKGRITRSGSDTYASVQIIKSAIIRDMPEKVFSLNRVWDRLISQERAYAVHYPAPWYDIGTKDSFDAAARLGII